MRFGSDQVRNKSGGDCESVRCDLIGCCRLTDVCAEWRTSKLRKTTASVSGARGARGRERRGKRNGTEFWQGRKQLCLLNSFGQEECVREATLSDCHCPETPGG